MNANDCGNIEMKYLNEDDSLTSKPISSTRSAVLNLNTLIQQ